MIGTPGDYPLLDDEDSIKEILDDLEAFCRALIEEHVTDQKTYVSMVLFLFSTYLRENCLGPSVYTEYVEDTLAPLVKGHLPLNALDPISHKNKHLQGALLKHYERDGEQLYHKSQFLVFLYWLEMLVTDTEVVARQTPAARDFAMLWRARLKFQLD